MTEQMQVPRTVTLDDGTTLTGRAAVEHLAHRQRDTDATRARNAGAAVARVVAALARQRTGLPAAEALACLAGKHDALVVLELAGEERPTSWALDQQRDADIARSRAQADSQAWAIDLAHDPRVMAAIGQGTGIDAVLSAVSDDTAAHPAARRQAAGDGLVHGWDGEQEQDGVPAFAVARQRAARNRTEVSTSHV